MFKNSKYVASYIIGSQTLRLYNLEKGIATSQWLDRGIPEPVEWTSEALEKRCNDVFNKINQRVKCIILINSMQLSVDLVRQAHDVAKKFSEQVEIISPSMARLLYAINEPQKLDISPNRSALIVFILNDICEFNEIVNYNPNCYTYVSTRRCNNDQFETFLDERTRAIRPEAIICVSSAKNVRAQKVISEVYRVEQAPLFLVEKADFMLCSGALAKAAAMFIGNYTTPLLINDFAVGFVVDYIDKTRKKRSEPLIEFGSKIPAKATVDLKDIKSFCIKFNDEIVVYPTVPPALPKCRKLGQLTHDKTNTTSVKITANINKAGVPYMKVAADTIVASSVDKAHKPSEVKFVIKLNGTSGSICSIIDGKEEPILNPDSEEWTPLYVSLFKTIPVIGSLAKKHWETHPTYVISDIHKVIGLPFNKIQANKLWGFTVIADPDDKKLTLYELQTFEGRRMIRPCYILAMILKALTRMAEQQFDQVIRQLTIKISEDFSTSQFDEIQKAAGIAKLEIDAINFMGF